LSSRGVGRAYPHSWCVYTDTSGISIFALGRQQVPGCWRCGDKKHLRRDCTLPASKAELEGAPMNQWAKMPRVASSVAPPQAPFPSAARGSATSTTTVLAQMAALNARIDRQDTMFETILQRLPPLTPLPGVPMAAGALAQMAVPTAAVEAAPLIMGGLPQSAMCTWVPIKACPSGATMKSWRHRSWKVERWETAAVCRSRRPTHPAELLCSFNKQEARIDVLISLVSHVFCIHVVSRSTCECHGPLTRMAHNGAPSAQ